ncbi:MAG: hypothetical protein ACOCZ5_03735 [bacterium]
MIKTKIFQFEITDVGYGMYQHSTASNQLNKFIENNNIKDNQIQNIQFSGDSIMLVYRE